MVRGDLRHHGEGGPAGRRMVGHPEQAQERLGVREGEMLLSQRRLKELRDILTPYSVSSLIYTYLLLSSLTSKKYTVCATCATQRIHFHYVTFYNYLLSVIIIS